MDNVGAGGEAGFDAILEGGQPDTDGDLGLADTAGSKNDDILATVDKL